jgi:hypothetical protein
MVRVLGILIVIMFTTSADAQLLRSRSRVVVQQPVCANGVCNVQAAPVIQATPVIQAAPVIQAPVNHFQQPIIQSQVVGVPVPVQYTQPLVAQGNTVYGYHALSQFQNQVDMGLLYNQAARLTDQAQQLAGQAATDFQNIVQNEGQNRLEIAKIIAQGQAAKEALLAAKGPETIVQKREFSFKITQQSDGQFKIEQTDMSPDFGLISGKQSANNVASVSNLLSQKCVACHNDSNSMGGLNLLKPITEQQQQSIINRVVTDDESIRMPRLKSGAPAPKLSKEEIALLYQAFKAQ